VADLAGVKLDDPRGADFRRELAARKERQKRAENAAEKLENVERVLRFQCRDRIHDCERKQLKVSERLAAISRGEPERYRGESESLWVTLQAAHVLLESYLPTYTLLSLAEPAERAKFALHPELREEMISSVRSAGFVRSADGHRVEVRQ
jgi:hypothetical protein